MIVTIDNNLNCLKKILNFNVENNLLFFRISSDIVPFASHPICKFNWQSYFKDKFKEIGEMINDSDIRISMHPDQFIVINSNRKDVVKRSISELIYHCEILDLMGLNSTSKIQLHIGGAYGNKNTAIQRFIEIYKKLNSKIKKRLVIENDDKIYSLSDCLFVSSKTNIPVLFDVFHHSILNNNEKNLESIEEVNKTWLKKDGIPMFDYSNQEPNSHKGKHAETINLTEFKDFVNSTKPYNFDVMLEIKDKEKSAMSAIEIVKSDLRFTII
jgi:UV DNA damage endonuclease